MSAPSRLKLTLFPRDDNAAFLRPRDVADRCANSKLRVIVDYAHANALIESGLERLKTSGAPAVIIDSHMQQFDNCPFIRISHDNAPAVTFAGMVWFDAAIELLSESADTTIASKLGTDVGELLDYDYEIEP